MDNNNNNLMDEINKQSLSEKCTLIGAFLHGRSEGEVEIWVSEHINIDFRGGKWNVHDLADEIGAKLGDIIFVEKK